MILITGANGLVGSFLCRELAQRGQKVRALVRAHSDCSLLEDVKEQIDFIMGDVKDIGSLIDAMDGVDYVIHTAAVISFWKGRKEEMFQVNVEGTANVVNAAIVRGIKKFIHISSVAAIGRKAGTILVDESSKWEESSLNTAYANTKYLAELEVYRGMEEGLNALIINPSVILGPGMKGTSSVRLFEYVKNQNKYYTEGYMNYIDVRDLVESIIVLLENNDSDGRYIISAGKISYQGFFHAVAKELNCSPPHIKATSWMREIVWRAELIKTFFSGKEPLITKETARSANMYFEYSSAKFLNQTNFIFRPLTDTVQWSCQRLFRYD